MKIHEYQGKEILRQFGVPVPRGVPAFTVQEAVEAAQKLGGPVWVVKAQIHAGGRGKGGGVKVTKSVDGVKDLAGQILGMQLVTHQTGPEGQKVRRLYIEEGADIQKEYYVSLVTDRQSQKVAFIASSEGGMDIEEVAHATPEKIITEVIDPLTGLGDAQAAQIARSIGLGEGSIAQAVTLFQSLYRCYMETDASLVEINPLNCDSKGNIMALDSKFNFDANALFRHPEIVALRDLDEEDPAEVEASKFDLAYISLDGNIGCLVNGAGLAMATMDTIKLFGGEPANFLDVGGGATAEKVTDVSGHGVGMDVVRQNIERLRGQIHVTSRSGIGTTVTLRIPLTLASMDVMLVRVGTARYAIPLGSVRQSFRPRVGDITTTMDGLEVVRVREALFPVLRLHEMFNQKSDTTDMTGGILVIVESHTRKACIMVDEVLGQQQTVIKSLSQYIGTVSGLSGCMILSDGHIGLILDTEDLIRQAEERTMALAA